MLVLTRKPNQAITLNVGNIEIDIAIIRVINGSVTIGIHADRELVKIRRTELPPHTTTAKEESDVQN